MDPNATWKDLCIAIMAEDWEATWELTSNLNTWIWKGGFFDKREELQSITDCLSSTDHLQGEMKEVARKYAP